MDENLSYTERLALRIADWLPELNGRVFPVSEVDPFTDATMPSLPLAVLAVVRETYADLNASVTEYSLEIMLEPRRYERSKGGQTPFWAYYDYTGIRDRLIGHFQNDGALTMTALDIEADNLAVFMSFSFQRRFRWCLPPTQGVPAEISMTMKPGCLPDPDCKSGCDQKEAR